MTIRIAKPSDLRVVSAIAEATARSFYGSKLRISRDGIRTQIRGAISDASCLVLLDDKGSILIATAQAIGWAERKIATLQIVKSGECGQGRKLLSVFRKWCDKRKDIKGIVVEVDNHVDPRFSLLLDRIGIKQSGKVHSYIRS
ncbi:MAG: hypothetical protein R8K20_11985 [Gallionellaceae bacterium]